MEGQPSPPAPTGPYRPAWRIETITALIALGTALLPVAGIFARFVAFEFAPARPLFLASRAPLPDLFAAGALAITPAALSALVSYVLVYPIAPYMFTLHRFRGTAPGRAATAMTSVHTLRTKAQEQRSALSKVENLLETLKQDYAADPRPPADKDPDYRERNRLIDAEIQALQARDTHMEEEIVRLQQEADDLTAARDEAERATDAILRRRPFARSPWWLLLPLGLVAAAVEILIVPAFAWPVFIPEQQPTSPSSRPPTQPAGPTLRPSPLT